MSTLKEQADTIGRKAQIELGGLLIYVTVLDFKNSYGKDRWQVAPEAGIGAIWVEGIELID